MTKTFFVPKNKTIHDVTDKIKPLTEEDERTQQLKGKKGINVYAANSINFVLCREINDPDDKLESKLKQKCLQKLTELSRALKYNQWLKSSNDKYYDFNLNLLDILEYMKEEKIDIKKFPKPDGMGSWFSKGEWLFHYAGPSIGEELILIEVDYSNIYRINGTSPFSYPLSDKKYIQKYEDFIRKYKRHYKIKVSYGNSYTEPFFMYNIKWEEVMTDYDGFAIYPIPTRNFMRSYGTDFMAFDVASLVLKNSKPIIRVKNLGKFKTEFDIDNPEPYFQEIDRFLRKINKINSNQ